MISNLPQRILIKSAKKLGLKTTDLSSAKNLTRVLISDGKKMYVAHKGALFPDVSHWQKFVMNDKLLSQKILERLKYKTIHSHPFSAKKYKSSHALLADVKKLSLTYPLITKPNKGVSGKGITFIENEKQLVAAVKDLYKNETYFMIQPWLNHEEFRLAFVSGKPVMLHKKMSPRVFGTGTKTIKELLKEQRDIWVDENFLAWNLKQKNYTEKTILSDGERFETHMIKKPVSEYYKTSHFPKEVITWGKKMCTDLSVTTIGIDLLTPSGLEHPEKFIIIEINANPGYSYLIPDMKDAETPSVICTDFLISYFGKKKK